MKILKDENIIEECEWKRNYDNYDFENARDIDLNNIYDHAHSEMSLQQSKRDQIINIYIAMCTFIVPYVLKGEINKLAAGFVFIAISILGIIFSFVTIRYRIYKEIYWMCCQTITMLQSFRKKDIDKSLVQSNFFRCVKKRGSKYIKESKKKLSLRKYVQANRFSAETMYYLVIVLITAGVNWIGLAMVIDYRLSLKTSIIISGMIAIVIVKILMNRYFLMNLDIYKVLENEDTKEFNKIFSKAWFLHIYYD